MKVIIICAVTLDGRIARGADDPVDWTSSEDKKIFAEETKKAGVIIMGHHTLKAIGRPLKGRLNVVLTTQPERLKKSPHVLEPTNASPLKILRSLSRRGFKKAFVIGGSQINSLFLRRNLVDEVWLTLVPRFFGEGLPLVFGKKLDRNLKLRLSRKLPGGLWHLRYRLIR